MAEVQHSGDPFIDFQGKAKDGPDFDLAVFNLEKIRMFLDILDSSGFARAEDFADNAFIFCKPASIPLSRFKKPALLLERTASGPKFQPVTGIIQQHQRTVFRGHPEGDALQGPPEHVLDSPARIIQLIHPPENGQCLHQSFIAQSHLS